MTKKLSELEGGFGQRLARLRKDAGQTQSQLAEAVGATRRIIAYYEKESLNPPANLLHNLSSVLNVTVDELLGIEPVESSISCNLDVKVEAIKLLPTQTQEKFCLMLDEFLASENKGFNRR